MTNPQQSARDDASILKGGPKPLQLALATFGILALELAIIRWMGGQVRIFAYFSNVILIAAFLGMGLGVAVGPRRPGLLHWTLPALCGLSIVLAFSEQLGLMKLQFPDLSVHLWGAEGVRTMRVFGTSLVVVLLLFWAVVAVFFFAGTAVGVLFGQMKTLRAYSYDLLGSLAGVLVITLLTALGTGPHWWLLAGCLPFAWLSRRASSLVATLGIVALGWWSAGSAIFSPYNRIDIIRYDNLNTPRYNLAVNRDFHQFMHNLSDAALNDPKASPQMQRQLKWFREAYDIPFKINDRRERALVVGAGTGNDVQAALRHGYGHVHSVDIDGRIIELGKKLHPERPYDDPRTEPVVNDARAFFEQYHGAPFDCVCYGLLDSHAMFSAMSTLRLENYVYTEEGMRSAWKHVAPGGHMTVSFSVFAGDWISDRLFRTLEAATGTTPVMIHHNMHFGRTFIAAKPESVLHLDRIQGFDRVPAAEVATDVRKTSDNWPFLYIRPGAFPWGYCVLIFLLLTSAFVFSKRAFGARLFSSEFDLPMFLMGAAFLLIETRGVTQLSLLFGSTWLVNSAVFGGILLMVLLANVLVERFQPARPLAWFVPLLLSVLFIGTFNQSLLNEFSLPVRGIVGGIVNALPIGFAGVIVSIHLGRSRNPQAALGSNLIGSVVGGCLEYLSMWFGLKVLAAVAFLLYLGAMAAMARRPAGGVATESETEAGGVIPATVSESPSDEKARLVVSH